MFGKHGGSDISLYGADNANSMSDGSNDLVNPAKTPYRNRSTRL